MRRRGGKVAKAKSVCALDQDYLGKNDKEEADEKKKEQMIERKQIIQVSLEVN